MRKFSLFLLLATSAIPAAAAPGDRESRRSSQSEQSDNKPQRAERAQRSESRDRPQRQIQVEPQQVDGQGSNAPVAPRRGRVEQTQQQQGTEQRGERVQRYQQLQQEQQVQGNAARSERLERFRQRQLEARQQGGGLVQRDRRVRPIPVIQPEVGQVGPVRTDVRRDGRDGRRYDRDGRRYRDDRNGWANNWRHDRRYDWRRYRDRNRSIFSLGFYFDPFGFSYRRFGIGSYLYSGYYQSNYWINDPWQYRLPPAYGPYRWVRYHNDAVMIDTYTGEVVDVIYGFFW